MSQTNDLQESNLPSLNTQRLQQKFQPTNTNPARIFELIESLLPVRYCLSHKIVPLELSHKCLTLGMVNPEQNSILQEVCLVCGNQVKNFHLQPIDVHTHQLILSAYIKHSRQSRSPIAIPKQPIQERPTLIIEAPEQLPKIIKDTNPQTVANSLQDRNFQQIPTLTVKARYLSAPVEFLAALPPQLLWQELLGRVLERGIGRLSFERLAGAGKIVWSQNGALKLSLNSLDLSSFQGTLIELKKFVRLSPLPIVSVQQGQEEYSYQQERLLIRWRIHLGENGEEATMQILRGKALELYQHRQIKEWEEQALDLAKRLERKLQQMREFKQHNQVELEQIIPLQQLQLKIKRQLDLLN